MSSCFLSIFPIFSLSRLLRQQANSSSSSSLSPFLHGSKSRVTALLQNSPRHLPRSHDCFLKQVETGTIDVSLDNHRLQAFASFACERLQAVRVSRGRPTPRPIRRPAPRRARPPASASHAQAAMWGVFYIFIFFKIIFYRNIFSVSQFTGLYPYRPAGGM